jgi:ferrous iron transport protein A
MPLTFAPVGKETVVLEIRGKDDVCRHLENLGFVVGGRVTVVAEIRGDLIVNVKDTRIALNKGMANRIMIQ